MPDLRVYRNEIFLAGLFAVLYSAVFHFPALSGLAFIAIVPLLWGVSRLKSRAETFWFGYLAGALFFALTLYWVVHVTVAGFFALAAYLGLFTAAFCVIARGAVSVLGNLGFPQFRFGWIKVFTIAAAWVVLEYVRGAVPVMKFPWALAAYSQWRELAFIQSADLLGAWGVSFILVAVNACLFGILMLARRLLRFEVPLMRGVLQIVVLFVIGASLVGADVAYGQYALRRESAVPPPPEAGVRRIAVVQGNIPQHQKWDARIKDSIFQKYEGLTRQAAMERPHLIIWPETAFPGYWEVEPMMVRRFLALVREVRAHFLAGIPTLAVDGAGTMRMNTAVFFGPDGAEKGRYHKLRLVPFGEYVPFFGFIRRFFEIGRFSPGRSLIIFELPAAAPGGAPAGFAVLICFEDIFPDLCRSAVNRGADILVNITNDAWFKKTSAPYQHAQASVFRAVENRVPVVRAANTGLSCFIEPTGRIVSSVRSKENELFVTGFTVFSVNTARRNSLYRLWGDAFVWVLFVVLPATYPLYLNRLDPELLAQSA